MIDDVGKFCDNKLLEYEEKQNKKSSVDVLKEMRDNFSAMSKVSFGGTLIKQTNALSDGVVALEKLEELKEWIDGEIKVVSGFEDWSRLEKEKQINLLDVMKKMVGKSNE